MNEISGRKTTKKPEPKQREQSADGKQTFTVLSKQLLTLRSILSPCKLYSKKFEIHNAFYLF